MDSFWLVALAVLVTSILLWAYHTAQRLHRLHIRTDAALQALQSALDQRAMVVAVCIPEAAPAAHAAQQIQLKYATFVARGEREQAVVAAIAGAGANLPPSLADVDARVQLAHRFYNDAVADTRALRTRPMVRLLRLGGTAKLPEFFESIDMPASTPQD